MKQIDLNKPNISYIDATKIIKSCLKKNWVSTGGDLVDKFEKKICQYTGSKYAVACNSGTSALHISLKLCDVKQGDEVIVPTLTFIATINAVIYNSCSPIFMDSDSHFNIDASKTINFLKNNTMTKGNFTFNKKTKKRIVALIVTHVWGNAADISDLLKECKKRNIKFIEDASESLGTRYKKNKKHTGTFGYAGVLSFNANKIITTGSGGIILLQEKKLYRRAKYLTTQAKDDKIFFVHNDIGYNYRMNNISAAMGISQLKTLKNFLQKKRNIREFYKKILLKKSRFEISPNPKYSHNNNWMNILRIRKKLKVRTMEKIVNYLISKKILVRPIWRLNHEQKMFKNYENFKISNAKKLYRSSICIPSSVSLTKREQLEVIKSL